MPGKFLLSCVVTRHFNTTKSLRFAVINLYLKSKSRGPGHTSRPFVDMKRVTVQGGKGGDGCIAFDRLFCNPNGGPSGGDGGNGGHVVFKADSEVVDFSDVNVLLKAPDGARGSGSNRHGANAKALVIKVPPDTQIHCLVTSGTSSETPSISAHRTDSSSLLATLSSSSDVLIAARGGAGGRGNAFLASANQRFHDKAPLLRQGMLRLAERGAPGESRRLLLRLANFADIGLVGAPNAGKSTLLRRLTRARPRVASHPFTTLRPHVGTLILPGGGNDDSIKLTVADLPGIIEGAALRNVGLGAQFLSLIEGCSVLAYLVDVGTFLVNGRGSSVSAADAIAHFSSQLGVLHQELALFNPGLVDPSKVCLVIGTKVDLIIPPHDTSSSLDTISAWLTKSAEQVGLQSARVLLISAKRSDNIDQLVEVLRQCDYVSM